MFFSLSLREYRKFVTDGEGKIRRYFFDSNVRGFLGQGGVNADILTTLRTKTSPDFWWLNNGVTLLATNAGVTGKVVQLREVQIVNGLQTTESIFAASTASNDYAEDDRLLLVKVIVSTENDIRDAIIRATNNQSPIPIGSLRATDPVQRNIDDYFLKNGWFYERRHSYYNDLKHDRDRFITPQVLAAGGVALLQKRPDFARRLRSKHLRIDAAYKDIFASETPLPAWLRIAEILRNIDVALDGVRPSQFRSSLFVELALFDCTHCRRKVVRSIFIFCARACRNQT